MNTAYKLLRKRKDGSIGPLFINRSQRIPIGKWLKAEDHPTKGFAHRPFWHSTCKPEAPHLKMNLKSGETRIWCKVEIDKVTEHPRPASQGGVWYLSERLKVIRELEGHMGGRTCRE
jgi:hypothetical protein